MNAFLGFCSTLKRHITLYRQSLVTTEAVEKQILPLDTDLNFFPLNYHVRILIQISFTLIIFLAKFLYDVISKYV